MEVVQDREEEPEKGAEEEGTKEKGTKEREPRKSADVEREMGTEKWGYHYSCLYYCQAQSPPTSLSPWTVEPALSSPGCVGAVGSRFLPPGEDNR